MIPSIRRAHSLMQGPTISSSIQLRGHGSFAGERDSMIVCADVGALTSFFVYTICCLNLLPEGAIHVWDRETATHIHQIKAHATGIGLRCMAWGPHLNNKVQFATVGAGQLYFWSKKQPSESRSSWTDDEPYKLTHMPSLSTRSQPHTSRLLRICSE